MQFRLETNELNLLANLLLEQDARRYPGLFGKIMARDLRLDCDELEQAAEILAAKKRSLKEEIARETDVALKTELEGRLPLLERVLERVNEACVMF